MAEGWANFWKNDGIEAESAGVETHGVNPYAIAVMKEKGVDISTQRSKHIDEFELNAFDYIITVCDNARESCPVVPAGCRVIHESFDDPPKLAEKCTTEEEIMACYRRVRDDIRTFVEQLPEMLDELKGDKKHG